MNANSIGKQISDERKNQGLTQAELADRCRLNIRTIQRIESGEVHPRSYTVRIINEVLGTRFELNDNHAVNDEEQKELRKIYHKRRRFRIITAISAIALLILVTILAFPSWELFGMPKRT
jgi:transcriptional regulator with XRE-family HTH domain